MPRKPKSPNRVDVQVAHPRGRSHGRTLAAAALRYLDQLKVSGKELSVSLVTDPAIRKLNRRWRSKDQATDVLSFPTGELPAGTPGPLPLGDVVLSWDTARRQAAAWGGSIQRELERYLAHGLLHLLGHDHQRPTETRRMARLENALLEGEGMLAATAAAPKAP